MRKLFLFAFCLLSLAVVSADAQALRVPLDIKIAIVKAEDARRYDKTLEDLLKHKSSDVRTRALLAVGRIGDESAIPAITPFLERKKEKEMEMAAFALGEIESIAGADAVLKSLAIDKKGKAFQRMRSRLVEAAGKIAGANADHARAADLRAAIVNELKREDAKGNRYHEDTVLMALTAALRAASRDTKRNRPDESDVMVAKFLGSPSARVRVDAANALTRIRAKNANEVLRKILASDIDPIARANAARALAAAEDKEAIDELIKTATTDVDSRTRVAAIRAIATLRDAKAGEPLLARGEALLATYKEARKPDYIPAEQNEFIEIATALGRLMANTRNERAVNLFREFGKLDRGLSTEVYVARMRVAPGRGDGDKPDLTNWRQYSTLAQLIGEFARVEPTTEEAKQMKIEAPLILGPLAKAFAEADPVKDADTIMAAPDMLRAFAGFKTANLGELLRTALTNKDLFVRATAADLLADQPMSDENFEALNRALEYAIVNDTQYNDAVISTLDALFKLDKRKSVPALELAAGSLDHVVRLKVLELLKDDEFKNKENLSSILRNIDTAYMRQVRPYGERHTKLGQILNSDADYRRALGRKNGSARAVLTTQKGEFTIEFLPEDAPLTVDNFIKLANAGYFNSLEVHRLVANFVMQDGDPRGDGNGGPGWSIRCEMNTVPFDRGVVGMALSGKDTGGSQWFVTHSPQPHLDGGYTVFGRVNETGMQIVDKIVRGDKILSVKIVEK